ncbi:MAG: hypothetical protein QM760_00325 [Nibricoccus sp.]
MNTATSATHSNTASSAVATEDKTVAILSYLTLIGFIVAIVIHGNNKTRLGAYHLRQSLGLIIACLALFPVGFVSGLVHIPVLSALLGFVIWVGLIAFWAVGLIAAVNGQQKPVPVLGEKFQAWFGKAFE